MHKKDNEDDIDMSPRMLGIVIIGTIVFWASFILWVLYG